MIKIKMFTKTVCPTCKIAKQQLSFLPVPVEIIEYNIDENESAMIYLTGNLESMATPTFEFEDGTVIRGFEVGPIMEKLGL